jgi:hypothetical protein
MNHRTPRHAKPLTALAVEAEFEAWAAAGFPIPDEEEA